MGRIFLASSPAQALTSFLVFQTRTTRTTAFFTALFPALLVLQIHAATLIEGSSAQLSSNNPRIDLRRTDDNHLFLWGKANGKRISVLVDTGWSFTTWIVNSATRTNSATNIAQLKLGDVTLTNVPAVMQDVRFNGQPASFDLVLGVDFLRARGAVIDCAKRKLYLRTDEKESGTQMLSASAFPQRGFASNSLSLKTNLALTCPASVNGRPVELLVDTAAVWSCLDERQITRLELKPHPTLRKLTGAGKTGERFVAASETRSFAIGSAVLKNVNCAVLDLKDWGLAAPGERLADVQGILGGGELARLNAIIDCGSLTLWLKP